MSLIFDGVIIVIFIVTALIGFHRGFIRYVITMLGTFVSVIIALAAANFLTEPVYDRFIKDSLTNSIQTAAENIDVVEMTKNELAKEGVNVNISSEDIRAILRKGGNIAENVGDYLQKNGADNQSVKNITGKFDNYLHTNMTDKINSYGLAKSNPMIDKIKLTEETIDGAVSALASENKAEGARYLEKHVFAPPIMSVLKVILFGICFALITLLTKLILLISGILKKLPGVTAANRFGGLLLGLCKGALYTALLAFLYCTVVNSTGGNMDIINTENAEKSYLFKYFFDFFYK